MEIFPAMLLQHHNVKEAGLVRWREEEITVWVRCVSLSFLQPTGIDYVSWQVPNHCQRSFLGTRPAL